MGQLERYGLYVLCLVIFLILGVAIWGDSDVVDPVHAAGPGVSASLESKEQKGAKFEEMLAHKNSRMLENQRAAEELFRPATDGSGKSPVDPGPHQQPAGVTPTPSPVRPQPAPKPVELLTHVVKKGDNLESIARSYLGKGHLWRKILAINPGVDERTMKPGTRLKIPSREAVVQDQPVAAGRGYLVKKGDSAWKIAVKNYGESKAPKYSRLILELNGITNAGSLKPGTFIVLPK